MIISITLNPALDKTAEIDVLKAGGLNRLQNIISDAGGKGINVSKIVSALGGKSIALGFAGGKSGEEIVQRLNELKIENDFVKISQNTRTNLKIIDKEGALTEINEPGPLAGEKEILLLTEKILSLANSGSIFVFSGSLPKNAPSDIYANLINAVHKKGSIAFLDADGEAFKAALKEKPDFIKPNLYEMKQYFGVKDEIDLEQSAKLSREFIKMGIKTVVLTLGAKGALCLNDKETLFAPGLKVKAASTVGAGDSFTGAYAYALEQKMDWKKSLSLAMAASAGAVMTEGTKAPAKELIYDLLEQISLQELDKGGAI